MIRVAIDGPAGAGKSSVSKEVAKRCGLLYIDTGAMYRAITLLCLNNPENRISSLLSKTKIEFNDNKVFLNGHDVTDEIRSREVTERVSFIAEKKMVRNFVDKKSIMLTRKHSCLMDGRDIGTTVMPTADLKIYLDASAKVRAERRMSQLKLPSSEFGKILKDINKRDKIDSNRKISPLTKAEDAIHLITDDMTKEEVIDYICNKVEKVK